MHRSVDEGERESVESARVDGGFRWFEDDGCGMRIRSDGIATRDGCVDFDAVGRAQGMEREGGRGGEVEEGSGGRGVGVGGCGRFHARRVQVSEDAGG